MRTVFSPAKLRMRAVLLAVLASAVGGCPQIDTALPGPLEAQSFDGEWHLASVDKTGVAAVTISGGRIVEFDDGCAGSLVLISNSQPAVISGDQAVWSFVGTTPIATSAVTLTAVVQPDGSLRGTMRVNSGEPRSPKSADIVMTRRRELTPPTPSAQRDLPDVLARVRQIVDALLKPLLATKDLPEESAEAKQAELRAESEQRPADVGCLAQASQPVEPVTPITGPESPESVISSSESQPAPLEPVRGPEVLREPPHGEAESISPITGPESPESTISSSESQPVPLEPVRGPEVLREPPHGEAESIGPTTSPEPPESAASTRESQPASLEPVRGPEVLRESPRGEAEAVSPTTSPEPSQSAASTREWQTPPSRSLSTYEALRQSLHGKQELVFGLATAFVLLLFGSAIMTSRRARHRRPARTDRRTQQVALAAEQRAFKTSEFLRAMLASASPSRPQGPGLTVREVLDEAAERIESELCDQPEAEAVVRTTIGKAYQRLGCFDEAEMQLRAALNVRRRVYGNEHPETASNLQNLASVLFRKGETATAEALWREALGICRKAPGPEYPLMATALSNLALALRARGQFADAETMQREALRLHRNHLGDEHPHVADSLERLATLLSEVGKHAEAEAAAREALTLRRKMLGEQHPDVGKSLSTLAFVLVAQGRYVQAIASLREAITIQRSALGDDHEEVAASLTRLGTALAKCGKPAEAEPALREALSIRRKRLPHGHCLTADTGSVLGGCLVELGRYEEAESLLLDSYESMDTHRGAQHPRTQAVLRRIIDLYEAWRRPEEAGRYRGLAVQVAEPVKA